MTVHGKLPVPAALVRGASFRTIDFQEKEVLTTADNTGTANAQFDYLQQGHYWRIERLVVTGDSVNLCTVVAYQGDSAVKQRNRDGTALPPGFTAVSEYASFFTILPTRCLLVVITGANQGDVFNVTAQYQLVEKVFGQWAGQG